MPHISLDDGREFAVTNKQVEILESLKPEQSVTLAGETFRRSQYLGIVVDETPADAIVIEQPKAPKFGEKLPVKTKEEREITRKETKSLHDEFRDRNLNMEWYRGKK